VPIRCAFPLLSAGVLTICLVGTGCRHHTHAQVLRPDKKDMVGTTGAGAETFKPLVEAAVCSLLERHTTGVASVGAPSGGLMRICFIGVENKSAEEIGDFKEQIYEHIDIHIEQSHAYHPISKRYVDAALRETGLRPDELFVPRNMRAFTATLEQAGQPVDYLLFAKITSGTTRKGHDMQRDYVLTLELVNVVTGDFDKESAMIRKKYDR
jgi:hypothetical protein